MKIVEPNYDQMLIETHRRWIKTRDPADGDKFAAVVIAAAKASNRLKPGVCYCRNQFENSHCAYFKSGKCTR